MSETLKALDQFGARLLTLASSSKVWATAGGMLLAAFIGYHQGGWEGAAIAMGGILGLPAVYTVSKTYQNTHPGNGTSQAAAAVIPAAQTPAPPPAAAPASSSAAQPAAAPVPVVAIPFDKESFMAEVEKRVVSDYGVRNACTLFYEAQAVREQWNFNNQQAWDDCKAFMVYLGEQAFKEVWKETYDEALINVKKPDQNGCTYPNLEYKAMQLSIGHYAILLELKRVKGI